MPRQPNILLFMTDQQRADTVRALGNPYIQTPALDSLVEEGASFNSAFCATPVCQASRCSLLLGEHAQWHRRPRLSQAQVFNCRARASPTGNCSTLR